jgi:DNA excision repair protein ERCC-1
MLCWSYQEAARDLEVYKLYENKPASNIQTKVDEEHIPRLIDIVTSVKSINKTDALSLAKSFKVKNNFYINYNNK